MNPKKFAILFLLYLLVYLWFKSINEISFKSIEYLTNLNELLLVVIVTGVSYYILIKIAKAKDAFLTDLFNINLRQQNYLLISIIASVLVFLVSYVKMQNWGGNFILVPIASSLLTIFVVYYSLRD